MNITAQQIQQLADGLPPFSIGLDYEEAITWLAKALISLNKQMSILEQTGIAHRERAERAEAKIAALKDDFILLDRQMSFLERTGITDRDRADKAEAQLAELAKLEPVGVARMELAIGREGLRYYQCFVDMRPDVEVAEINTGIELFTRAAPPAPVVVNRPGTECIGWVRDAIREHDAKWIAAVEATSGSVADE